MPKNLASGDTQVFKYRQRHAPLVTTVGIIVSHLSCIGRERIGIDELLAVLRGLERSRTEELLTGTQRYSAVRPSVKAIKAVDRGQGGRPACRTALGSRRS